MVLTHNTPMDIQYRHNYFSDHGLRGGFMSFAHQHFGLDFSPWQNSEKPWPPGYIAFSAFHPDTKRCIASLSVLSANLWINHKKVPGLQLLTVATDPQYRRRGIQDNLWNNLLTWLHDHRVSSSKGEPRNPKIHPKPRVFFLTTRPGAVALYEHLGFQPHPEYALQIHQTTSGTAAADITPRSAPEHLNPHTQEHRGLISRLCQGEAPTSTRLYAQNKDLLEFLCFGPWMENLWYLKDLDTLVILEPRPEKLVVHQLIAASEPNPLDLYQALTQLIPLGGGLELRFDVDSSNLPQGFTVERTSYSEDILMLNSNISLPRNSMLPLIARA